MENEQTLGALLRKRAELAGLFDHHQAVVRQLLIDIDSLDATIRMFAPDIDLADVKPKPLPPRHAAYKGEVVRIVLDTLRDAKRPCSTQELAMHVMAERGMNSADKRLVKTVTSRVSSCLRYLRSKGSLRNAPGLGDRLAWEVVS